MDLKQPDNDIMTRNQKFFFPKSNIAAFHRSLAVYREVVSCYKNALLRSKLERQEGLELAPFSDCAEMLHALISL